MRKLFELSASEEAEAFGEAPPEDAGLDTASECISGMGIVGDEVDDEAASKELDELLGSFATERSEEDIAREREERDAYERAENDRIREIEERYNKERYEKEQALKAERLERERLEKEEEEEEAREEFEQTFVGKLTKLFKKKPKEEKEGGLEVSASYTGEEEDALPVSEVAKEAEKISEAEEIAAKEEEAVPIEEVASTKTPTQVSIESKAEVGDSSAADSSNQVPEKQEMPAAIDATALLNGSVSISDITNKEESIEEIAQHSEAASAKETEPKKAEKKEAKAKPEKVSQKAEKELKAKKSEQSEVTVKKPKVEKAKEKAKKVLTLSEAKKPFGFFTLAKPARKEEEKVPVSAASDTSKAEEIDWKYIATHDENTGLGNTRAFKVAKEKAGTACAILFFDVNNLKYVNDNYGHEDGDLLLKRAADAIAEQFGTENAYRTGGDEFVVILPNSNGKKAQEQIGLKVAEIHKAMQAYMKKSDRHVPHSISVGLAVGDGKHTVSDVLKAADAAMYRNKKAYKESHPEFNARLPKKEEKEEAPEKDHDELLSRDQKDLKTKIKSQHTQPSKMSTETILREIQRRASDVHAIFIASPNFDYLYIIRDVGEFVAMALERSDAIDYSYLYVVWEGGPQYYGADTYYNEVTDLFKEIAEGLMSGRFRSEKDIKGIKGINIFRCVYV